MEARTTEEIVRAIVEPHRGVSDTSSVCGTYSGSHEHGPGVDAGTVTTTSVCP
jgi:hypothetical protein